MFVTFCNWTFDVSCDTIQSDKGKENTKMKCEKCLDKNGCPLYRGESTDTCWYEIIRKEKEKNKKSA